MWGRADVGQLGLSSEFLANDQIGLVQNTPTQVSYFAERRVHVWQIATGEAHTVVLDSLG